MFIAFIFATIVFSAFAGVPSILTILRCVYVIHNHYSFNTCDIASKKKKNDKSQSEKIKIFINVTKVNKKP